jgi:hypothetical protein
MLTKSQIQTPFGNIQTLTVLTDGISHFYAEKEMIITQGTALSPERNEQIPACARRADGLYAGSDMLVVDLVFAEELSAALGDPWGPDKIQRTMDRLQGQSPALFSALMAERHSFPKPVAPAADDPSPDF